MNRRHYYRKKSTLILHTEFLEELKRAQKFRLEDQRGTKISIELPDFLKVNEKRASSDYLKATQTYSPSRSFSYPENTRLVSSFKGERSESLVKLSSSSASPTKSIKSDHSGELNASTMCMPSQTPNKIAHSPSSNHNSSINSSEFRSVAARHALFTCKFTYSNFIPFQTIPLTITQLSPTDVTIRHR